MPTRRAFIKSVSATTLAAALPSRLLHAAEPALIGFVYVSPLSEAGWTHQHDEGRRAMERALAGRVVSRYVENVAEGADAERVIREFAVNGARAVFATSFGYMNATEKVARQFPQVMFFHATGYKSNGKNFVNYNARFYEGRYLCGVVAGKMSKSNILGYVAAFPIPEVLQGINAYTRGARSVNPAIRTRVIWTNSWFDPGKERDAALALMAQGADILTNHTDSTAVMQTAEEKGIYACGYHSDLTQFGRHAQLTATTAHWGDYYTRTVRALLDGTYQPQNIWGGMKEGMIRLAPFNKAVPAALVNQVGKLETGIKTGRFHPFAGPLLDQDGKIRLPAGSVLSDDALNQMNYYVDGVESALPG